MHMRLHLTAALQDTLLVVADLACLHDHLCDLGQFLSIF